MPTLSATQEIRCGCDTSTTMSVVCLISIWERQSAHLICCISIGATSGSDASRLYLRASVPDPGIGEQANSEPGDEEGHAGLLILVSDQRIIRSSQDAQLANCLVLVPAGQTIGSTFAQLHLSVTPPTHDSIWFYYLGILICL